MISTGHLVTTCLLIFQVSSICSALRMRRSDVAGYDDTLTRSQRFHLNSRLRKRAAYNSLLIDNDASYFNPNSGLESEYLRLSPYLQEKREYEYYPEYRTTKRFPNHVTREEYPDVYNGLDRRLYGPQKRRAYNPHRVVPTVDELKTLFGSADVPMKRTPFKRRVPIVNDYPAIEAKQEIVEEVIDDKSKSLVSTMRKLIDAAGKLSKEEITVEKEDGKPAIVKDVVTESVSPDAKDKLKKVFEEATTMDKEPEESNTDNTDEVSYTEEPTTSTDDNIGNSEQAQSKSKRASSGLDDAMYIEKLTNVIQVLKEKISNLELKQILEDKENDYLANALKYATLDQLGGADNYIGHEFDDINKATETEELMQLLSDKMGEGEGEEYEAARERLDEYLASDKQDIDVEDEADNEVKRSRTVGQTPEVWYEEPVEENVSYGAKLGHSTDDDDTGPYGVGSEYAIDIPYPDENEVDDDEDGYEAEEDQEAENEAMEEEAAENEAMIEAAEKAKEEVDEELEEENEEGAKEEEMLSQLLRGLSPAETAELISELKYEDNDDDDQLDGICPAVLDLSENCAFADAFGIPIDDDARNLCSRHQICYACGSDLGIAKDGCDSGYRGTVEEACDGDRKCVRNALIFLRLMQKYHTFEKYSPSICHESCVQDFIYGAA